MTRREFLGGQLAWLALYPFRAFPRPSAWFRARLAADPATTPAGAWWRDMFSLVSSPSRQPPGSLSTIGATAFRGDCLWGGWYGSSYVDWEKTTGSYQAGLRLRRDVFKRWLMYYDGGEVGEFALFTDAQNRPLYSGWSLPSWPGTPPLQANWFGFNSFFSNDRLGGLKTAADLGVPALTMPDGARPANFYDAVGCRDIKGARHYLESSNARITDAQAEASGLAAISHRQAGKVDVQESRGWVTSRLVTADYAAQPLGDYEAWDLARCYAEADYPDGFHIDNYGDNNLHKPFLGAFGPWSMQTFREFLARHFPAAELATLGVADAAHFDLRPWIIARCGAPFGAKFLAKSADIAWLDDPVWMAYVVNHATRAGRFHRAKFDQLKAAARAAGRDVLLAGNMIPLFAGHSLVQGALDIAHFEWNAFRSYHPQRQILGFPPQARSGYLCRLAAACSLAGYAIISLYVPKALTGEAHQNLFLVQAFEALTNRCVLDYGQWYLDEYSPGTPETAGIFSRFLDTHAALLTQRRIAADIGVIYDQWADVAATTPFGLDLDVFADDYAGWCRYLTMARQQWDVLPSQAMTAASLAAFRAVLLPSCVALDDAQWTLLADYARQGGIVIATGGTGSRGGPDRLLARRTDQPLSRIPNAIVTPDQPGVAYERHRTAAEAAPLAALLERAGIKSPVRGNLPETLTVTIYRAPDGGGTIDFQNNDFDLALDTIHPVRGLPVEVVIPQALEAGPRPATWHAPDEESRTMTVTVRREGAGSVVALTLPDLAYFGVLAL